MDISLQGVFQWIQTQAVYALFIVGIVAIIVLGAKRAWIAMIGTIIGIALIGIFVIDPEIITDMATWLGDKLNMK
jgi:uncharacterized membrane protein